MNAVILFVVIAILIYMIYIFNRISEIKSKTDKIADGVKDLYLQINHAVTDIHIVDTKIDIVRRHIDNKHLEETKKNKFGCYKDRLNEALTDIHTHLLMRGVDCDVRTNECYNGKKCITFILNYPLHADTVNPIKDILRNKCVHYECVSCDGRYWLYIFRDEC